LQGDDFLSVNATELSRFGVIADQFDKGVKAGLRKRIRNIVKGTTEEVKRSVRDGASGDSSVGSRDAIAASTSFRLSFASRSAGGKITTSNARLDRAHKGFAAAYNEASFRHPVYGNKATWVSQSGRPYFGSTILEHMDGPEVKKEIEAALTDAVKAIGGVTL